MIAFIVTIFRYLHFNKFTSCWICFASSSTVIPTPGNQERCAVCWFKNCTTTVETNPAFCHKSNSSYINIHQCLQGTLSRAFVCNSWFVVWVELNCWFFFLFILGDSNNFYFLQTSEHQKILCANGAVSTLASLLSSPVGDVQLATLDAIASLCYQNQRVSALLTVSRWLLF